MVDHQYQDAITYSQPLLKEITDDETIQLFKDKNLSCVIEFLRTHKDPMTVTELEDSFKKIGEEKSDKTIYRYLKKLEDAGLVIQAGKRVFKTKKKKLKTLTLYMRTATIFLIKPQKMWPEEILKAIGISIAKHMNMKLNSINCLENFLKNLNSKYYSYPMSIIQNAETEITDIFRALEFDHASRAVETISLLALLNEKADWQKELAKCFDH
ncbi:MAG: winged-helix domain-containing protein [Candidatus Hodarchaeota archaeon]